MTTRIKFLRALTFGVATAGLLATGPVNAKVEGDTITLGSAISFTGKYSTNGIHAKRGYNLAVKRINETGGVKVGGKAYKLKIIYYDDESTPLRTAQLAERLIKQDGIKFFLGPYSSATTKALAPITEKYKIPMVEAEGASRSLFNKGYKYIFAVLSTSEQYLASSIALAAQMAKSGDWEGKLLVPLGMAEKTRDAAGLAYLDEAMAEVLDGSEAAQEILGYQRNLASALQTMVKICAGGYSISELAEVFSGSKQIIVYSV